MMQETATKQALLDLCPECGGLWVDWQDGELRAMAKSVAAARLGGRPADGGSGRCPDCDVPLAEDEIGDDKVPIARCGECAGAYLPAATLARVRASRAPGERLPADETPALTRMLDTLTRWILPG